MRRLLLAFMFIFMVSCSEASTEGDKTISFDTANMPRLLVRNLSNRSEDLSSDDLQVGEKFWEKYLYNGKVENNTTRKNKVYFWNEEKQGYEEKDNPDIYPFIFYFKTWKSDNDLEALLLPKGIYETGYDIDENESLAHIESNFLNFTGHLVMTYVDGSVENAKGFGDESKYDFTLEDENVLIDFTDGIIYQTEKYIQNPARHIFIDYKPYRNEIVITIKKA